MSWKGNGRDEDRAWFQGNIRIKETGMEGLDLGSLREWQELIVIRLCEKFLLASERIKCQLGDHSFVTGANCLE